MGFMCLKKFVQAPSFLDSILKIVHFWPNIVIWFIDYNGKRITDKKMRLTRKK